MVMRFIARGMGKVDAELCVAKMAQYETFFVNLMVTEELGLRLPDDDDGKLLTDAFLMTVSFGLFGSLPLVVYFFGSFQYRFITELNMTITGKSADYSNGMNYFLVSLVLALGSATLWSFILYRHQNSQTPS